MKTLLFRTSNVDLLGVVQYDKAWYVSRGPTLSTDRVEAMIAIYDYIVCAGDIQGESLPENLAAINHIIDEIQSKYDDDIKEAVRILDEIDCILSPGEIYA